MITKNAAIGRFVSYIQEKDVYIYGLGDVYRRLTERDVYPCIHARVAGFLDSGKAGQTLEVMDKSYPIHDIGLLKQVTRGVVLICSTKCMREMYEALGEANLPDGMECFFLPFIWAVSDGRDDEALKKQMQIADPAKDQIEKKINCFWFSGEEKPAQYQKCIDSWKRVCPDYEIIEWNADTYDCEKNLFVKQAFEKRKWAFVSDYARLDVIYHNGGIYLDMDVELLQTFDPLLQFRAFFNFSTQFYIDLGSGFGSVKGNPFLGRLLELYEDIAFVDENGEPMTWKYMQPAFLRDSFQRAGVRMNGDMQLVDGMLMLPRRYYTPMDDFLLKNYLQCEDTRGVHMYNAGWCSNDFHAQRDEYLPWLKMDETLES